ncbi:MAG: Fic family protein [Acidobacteria bacterium]|nr:Fic family protein [Acidobacteriota bacterium]
MGPIVENGFELKTRRLFGGIIEQRGRWTQRQGAPGANEAFERLTGDVWAGHNCALDHSGKGNTPLPESRQDERRRHHECHVKAWRWFLERAQQSAAPTPADLRNLHSRLMGQSQGHPADYRHGPAAPLLETHDPAEPELVPQLVDAALEWCRADSFAEMHEVEQAALVLLKLTDIQPFDRDNGKTLRLFSNFFLVKAGYPPAVIRSELAGRYSMALQKALCYQTGPLVELLTESVAFSLGYCLGEPPGPPSLVVLD